MKTKSQTTSSRKSSPKKKNPIKPKTEPNFSVDYESELSWKCFNNNLVQIDLNYFDDEQIESIGFEELNVEKMADFELDDSLNNYLANIDYWFAEKSQLDFDLRSDQRSGKKSSTTRSKGSLKDFYTLPHLNAIKSSEKRTKAQNTNTRKSNEFARLMTDASNLMGSLQRRTSTTNSLNKVKPKPPVRQSSSKRGSSSAKSEANNKRETRSRKNPKLEKGVTSSTLFTTTSIHSSSLPFYESDIRVVTDLKGYKKVSFLKSLCEEFEIQTNKLPDRYVQKYKNQNINPFLFNDIYYNDYSGYLSDDESQFKQDVIITMRNVIENVVQVSHCVDSLLNKVQKELEPQPMIDTREDEYFHENNDTAEDSYWDYGHYADDSEFQGLQEIGLEERDNGLKATNEDMIANGEQNNTIDDYENENQTSFADNSELETKNTESEGFINSYEEQEVERNDDKEVNNSNDCLNNGDNNYDENNESYEYNERENNSENEMENEDQNGEQVSQMCESYDIGTQAASEEFSPSSARSGHYSNNNSNQYIEQNSPNDLQNQYQEEEEEELDQSNGSSSNSLPHNNIPPNLSNLGITPVAMHPMSCEPEFKMQTTYSSEMFNYNMNTNPQSYQQMPNIASVATHIVPPIMPTVASTHTHYTQQTVYTQQQSWPQINVMPINGMTYNIPNVNNSQNVLNTPQEPEFDVSNFSYMGETYYSNPNIPQFDGIFDDDSFQSDFNHFNMNCKPDNNIEHLSQGSRSEEMSQTNSVHQRLSTEALNVESNGLEAMPGNHRNDEIERYFKNINGVVVNIPKSIPDALLQKIGREVLTLERLKITLKNDDQYVEDIFSEDDSKKFFKTSLIGKEKLNYLQSLCKDFHISINRLNFHNFNDSTLEYSYVNKTRIPVSSFSNQFILKNKNFCVQNESNSSSLSIIDNETTQNNSESNNKINDSENGIYSFYLNETPPNLSQSTVTSIRSLNKSLDKLSGNSYKHHSTPLNHKKCKPLSDILETNDFQLTGSTQGSSHQRRKSFEKLKFDDSITSRNRQKLSCDSVIEGPTLSNTYDFEISSASALNNGTPDNLSDCEHQYLTTMSVEVHVTTRANLNPDPNLDNIEVIFYSISNDSPSDSEMPKSITGLIAVEQDLEAFNCAGYTPAITSKRKLLVRSGYRPKDVKIEYATDEVVLLMMFVDIVKQYDPDIIVGYEIDTLSWGYVLQRANVLNMNVLTPLSRIIEDKYCRNTESTANNACHLSGRITMNLWRIMRSEVTLKVYTYENVHYHVLHERIPNYDYSTLTQWYSDAFNHLNRWRVMDYYVTRVKGCLRLLDKLDFITRNSELARLFGIQFSEVFNRGSQFRVESIMLRSAKQFNYMAVSPNPRQVANMKAPESLPLILEPESKYYTDPVAVLDFQSLYPSMMIAYNYCYSTCLGRVDQLIK